MARACCPGSFDPVTRGHEYVFARAAARFDELLLTVVVNPSKRGMFDVDQRIALLADVTADLGNVRVESWTGLLVDYLRDSGVTTIVKGLRSQADFAYELPMAQMNRELADVETMFMLTDPRYGHVSSSLVKEVARLGGDVSPYVSPRVLAAINEVIHPTRRI